MSPARVDFDCNNLQFVVLFPFFNFHAINWKLDTRFFVLFFTALVSSSGNTLIFAFLHPLLLKFLKHLYASCKLLSSFKILFTTFVWQQCSFLYAKKKGVSQYLISATLSCYRANDYFIYLWLLYNDTKIVLIHTYM